MTMAVAATVASALWVARVRSPGVPLHFWVQAGDETGRVFIAPNGPEIPEWRIDGSFRGGFTEVRLVRHRGFASEWLREVGLDSEDEWTFAFSCGSTPWREPWSEWCVGGMAPWPSRATIDETLVGTWRETGGRPCELRADGVLSLARYGYGRGVWARAGRYLLFGFRERGTGPRRVLEIMELESDLRTYRGHDGVTGTREE